MKRFGLCSDHAGFLLKEEVKKMLEDQGVECIDFGCYSEERADYPDFAHRLGEAIDKGELEWGVAICGSGNGISMALNKHPRVRAALSWTAELAQLGRAHNDANVLSLPARFISVAEAQEIVMAFLSTDFEGGRHEARVAKIPLQ
ncbi:MAG: ribose 5-phosphate isomerase B [Bacteroidales bacterium]|nr:ribose 5-phosphate isomerase B [Porphyromonas sp.]MDD6934457.1 ribose 5-phosphate isomerase B [Bacteroidales bacterium]MDY3101510.1 ribose 5-phosphate isomerase B [Porphyromonas sp.]